MRPCSLAAPRPSDSACATVLTLSPPAKSRRSLQITRMKPRVLVPMGVSGCGKTTVAAILASRLGWPLEEGDALHPQGNIEKMAAGHPLTDADRWPWLAKVADWIQDRLDAGENGIITCSGPQAFVPRPDQSGRFGPDIRFSRRVKGDDRGAAGRTPRPC